jgi:2-oxoglutarate dehydrogenase E1 component
VCQPSLPSQYFHLLRRQMKRRFRKPLVLMMPKSLLRNEASASAIEDFVRSSFQTVIDDPTIITRERVRRLLLCSGKVYFALNAAREKYNICDVAIVRVEQFYPYPHQEVSAILSRYNRAQEVAWVQEEPKNRGAWRFMEPLLREMLPGGRVLMYYGRDASASPATGSHKLHQLEEQEFLSHALDLPAVTMEKAEPAVAAREAARRTEAVSD